GQEPSLARGGHLGARPGLAHGGRVPVDLEDPLGLGEALQLVEPEIDVLNESPVGSPQLDAPGDVPGRFGDEDLPGFRSGTDARRQVHRAADIVTVFLADRLAGVDADADGDPGAPLVRVWLRAHPRGGERARGAPR